MSAPPTNRGVTYPLLQDTPPASCGLDWLQYSVPWPDALREWPTESEALIDVLGGVLPPHDKLILSGEILRPVRGYNAGMSASFGRVFWHNANRRQHIGVIFTGDDMRAAVSVMLPHSQMLAWAVSRARSITRLDFAIDVYDRRAEPRDLLHLWKRGEVVTPAHVIREVTSWSETREHGIVSAPTIYIGRNDSERMLRVYDKARQMGEAGHWVRIELQTRSDQSMALAGAMQSAGIPATGRQAIRNFARCPKLEWYELALVGPMVGIPPVKRRETNTDRWLRLVALPALQRAATDRARLDDWTLYDALERALSDVLKDSGPQRPRKDQ